MAKKEAALQQGHAGLLRRMAPAPVEVLVSQVEEAAVDAMGRFVGAAKVRSGA